MKYLFVLSTLLLVACGQPKAGDPRSINGVDSAFNEEIKTYLDYKSEFRGISGLSYDIPIQFGELDGDTVGLCTRWSNGYRQIVIDRSYWYSTSYQRRLSLIAHELGHCDLNLGHNPTPNTIMYEYNNSYVTRQDFAELFGSTVHALEHEHTEGCVKDIEVQSPGNQF